MRDWGRRQDRHGTSTDGKHGALAVSRHVTIAEFVRRYLDARNVSSGYALTLRKRCELFARFAGCDALSRAFTEERMNDFLRTLTCSAWTCNKYRGDLLCVWRSAADNDLIGYPNVRRIIRLRQPPLIVECYTPDEARAAGATPYSPADGRNCWACRPRPGDCSRT